MSGLRLVDAKDLPVLAGGPVCPAALSIEGACRSQQGVVCRIMQRDHERDAGVRMTAAAAGFIQHEATAGVYLNLKSDPSTVVNFCYGDAVPVVTDEDGQGRASYTYCPVWQEWQRAREEGRDVLCEEPEPEPVAMGVPEDPGVDPWVAARRDLDLLAPPAAQEAAWR